MSTADAAHRLALAVREGATTVLAVAAIVAIVLGLMYLLRSWDLPHLLLGQARTGDRVRRAVICLVAGCSCAVAAWLIRPRRPARSR
ncbi:MAG TPA: hypothetical protein VMV07_06865 [Streptosporangiaceae bacterium]|nr:hypothetical protein [Streptosporangiaceae bacterium]